MRRVAFPDQLAGSPLRLGHYPVLGICGYSGSGKTTLIERVLPELRAKGLKTAVIKHDVHGIQVDRPGKDSDRLFKAGADVFLQGPEEHFFRCHNENGHDLVSSLNRLVHHYDLVLVEGHKDSPMPKIWLLGDGETCAPPEKQQIITTLSRDADRPAQLLSLINEWLPRQWLKTPVYACVLIGGASRRMGRPKHLISRDGKTWLERTIELVEKVVDRVVIVGAGRVPEQLGHYTRLPDVPDVQGPMTGMLAAMRWGAEASWLVCACDMPDMSLDALHWLLRQRTPGAWAVMPVHQDSGRVEPLLAHYDFRARELLEAAAFRHLYAPGALASHSKIMTLTPPKDCVAAWKNVNTEAELAGQ